EDDAARLGRVLQEAAPLRHLRAGGRPAGPGAGAGAADADGQGHRPRLSPGPAELPPGQPGRRRGEQPAPDLQGEPDVRGGPPERLTSSGPARTAATEADAIARQRPSYSSTRPCSSTVSSASNASCAYR